MKTIKIRLTIILLMISTINIVYGYQNEKKFILNGEITNRNEGIIIIQYLNNQNQTINDTSIVKQGKFYFEGSINEPTLAYLKGNVKNGSIDDPNFTELYLEPKKINILITENEFKSFKVTGSKTQDEVEVLKTLQRPIHLQLIPLNKQFSEVRKTYANGDKSDKNKSEIDKLRKQILGYINQIEKTNFEFVLKNPDSYASAMFLGTKLDLNNLPVDSAKYYYQSLSTQVQSSYWGRKVFQDLQARENSTLSEIAPLFKLKDINGKEIALADYYGKNYVLLDFWASWCVPCRESTPAIKALYQKYHSKGLEIISVSIDDNEKSWRTAVSKDNIPWENVIVGSKPNKNSLKTMYNVVPVPDYVLIDKEGKIIGRPQSIIDSTDEKSLTKLLEEIFKN